MPKLICAPMATLSHEAFRRTIEKFGSCDEYFTEMINAPSLLNMGPFEKYYLLDESAHDKIVWQLTGNSSEPLGKAAGIVAQRGGIGVDINMGCSAPQIYKTGAGIAWMLKPASETRQAVHLVKEALNDCEKQTGSHMRLSVKCRLGAEDFTDATFFAFTDMLVEEGVELITLHARTIKEKSRTHPRYEYVQKLIDRYHEQIQIYLNGDIKDVPSAKYALSCAPKADGLMIARAAAQKPWIFREVSDGLTSEQTDTDSTSKQTIDMQKLALDFVDDVIQFQPPEFHKTRLQRFFSYYCDNFSFGHYFKMQLLNAHNTEETKERIIDYFSKEKNDRYKIL